QLTPKMAPIAVGDVIPDGTVSYFDEQDQLQSVSVHSLAKGKKGVEEILCVSVNDPFVMKAWAKTFPENKHVKFLADGAGKYTHSLGLELDLSEKGLGVRSRRYALLVDDLKVKVANVEAGGEFTVSGADEILKALECFVLS
ncbi:Peroxiredoxin-2C, partial [Capsicum annuum]